MFGDVSAWFYKYLAGIQVDEAHPGFRQFFIDPYFPEDLVGVEASYPSPQGNIDVRWQRNISDIIMKIQVPVNTKAILKLQLESTGSLKASEGSFPEEHVKHIGLQDGKECFEVQPGSYSLKITE